MKQWPKSNYFVKTAVNCVNNQVIYVLYKNKVCKLKSRQF